MNCLKCGADNEDNAVFCTSCGERLHTEMNEDKNLYMEEESLFSEENNQNEEIKLEFAEEPEMKTEDINLGGFGDTVNSSNGNKKNGSKILLICIAVLALLCATAVFAGDTVLSAISPKLYVAKALVNTDKKLALEQEKIKNEFYPNQVDLAGDYTTGVKFKVISDSYVQEVDSYKDLELSVTSSVFNSLKELEYQLRLLNKEDPVVSANIRINEEELSVSVPELVYEDIVIPAKDFGKKWNDSVIGSLTGKKMDESLQLNFSNLIKESSSILTKESIDAINNSFVGLAKKAGVAKPVSAKIDMGGKTVKAKNLKVVVSSEDFKATLAEILEIIKKDSNIKMQIELSGNADGVEESFDSIIESVKELEMSSNVVTDLSVYKNIIVKWATEIKLMENEEESFIINLEALSNDKKAMMNDLAFKLEIKLDGEAAALMLNSKGNHIPNGKNYTDETSIVFVIPVYEKPIVNLISKSTIDLNTKAFDSNINADIDLHYDYDYDEVKVEINAKGKFDNSKGINLAFDDLSIKYNSNEVENFMLSLQGEYFVNQEASKLFEPSKDKLKLLDMQFTDIITKITSQEVQEKYAALAKKLDALFDAE